MSRKGNEPASYKRKKLTIHMSRRSRYRGFPVAFLLPDPSALPLETLELLRSVLTVGGTLSAGPCGWVISGSRMHRQSPGVALPPITKTINTPSPEGLRIRFSWSGVSPDQPLPPHPVALDLVCWVILPWACQSSLGNCLSLILHA